MKKINTTLTIISLILLCTLVSFVGCSDMMATLGNISLTIDLDTPEVEVASYILEGNLVDSNSRFTLNNIVPPRHTISELKEGRWNLTVKAFDDQDNQIGIGTKAIDLRAGQVVDTSLLVVFGQSTPLASAFTIAGPSRNADREGTISGTTAKMEYRLASAAEDAPFTACTAGSTNLAPGSYKIRYAAAHGLQASECLTVTVPAYTQVQLTITSPTLTTTKEYDGTNTVQGSMTVGTLSGVLSGDEVTVHAQASYDSSSVGNSKTITVTYFLGGADANNYLKPVNATLAGVVIQPKQLSITGTTVTTSKEYDNSTNAAVLNHGSLVGVIGSEAVSVTAHPVYQDKHAGTGKLISVSYTLGGTHAGNYLAPANTSFSGAITRKALSITGTPVLQARDYDGGRMAQVTNPGSLSGVLAGESVSMQATATYENKTVGNGKSATVSYSISGPDALNYTAPSDAFGTGDIRPKQLTVTDFNLVSTKEYDGSASSTINNVACSGMIPTDDVQVSAIATYNSSAAGTNKPITVTYTLAGDDSGNYLKPADSIASATGEIARKQLSVSGTTVANKDYDGTTLASLSSQGMLGGVVVGNTVTFTAVGTYDTKHAGENKDVTVAYTLSGSDKDNYLAPANAVLTGTIHKKLLTAKDIDVTDNKEYDGTIDADLNACTIEGIVAGDTVTVQKTATYDTALAGTSKIITVAFGLDGIDKDNYIKPADVEVTSVGVITKKQLMVSGTSLTTKDFDGTTNAPIFSQGRLEGIVDGDQVTFTAIANYATKDAGLNKSATVVYTLSGADKDNYLAPADGTLTGTIHKKLLTATSIGVTGTKEYDGTRNATITACTINGIVDVASVTVQKAATYDTKLAGSGKAITVSFSLEGADKDSYIEPDSRVVYSSGVIHQKQLAVSGTLYSTTKVYDGTANIPITSNGTLQGVVQGDVVALNTVTGSYANSDAGTEKAFVIRYTLSGVDAANYTVPDLTGTTGTISKAVLTATVGEHSRAYGAANPDFPVSVSGFVNGETASTASGYVEPTASTSATATTSAGTKSTITISGGSATNYSFNITDTGTLTITKAAMTGTVSITGSPVFGQVLTAVPALENTGTPTYQWKRNGAAISGATNTTYSLVEADIGNKISVTATATGTNYTGSITSEATAAVTKAAGSALSGTFEAYYPIVSADQTNITQDIINLTGFTANQTGIEASISTDGTSYENYSDLVIDSRGRAMISITSAKKVKLRYEETSTQSAGADLLLSVGAKDLAVGDYYAGGVVGYIYQSTDTAVYIANQVHGLIAAKSDTSDGIKWSSNITLQVGTAVEIGTGLTNTQAIIAALDGSEVGRYAAKEANSMRDGGYDDWFLPSFNELQRLRDNRILVGNFHTYNSSAYMSSSESTQKTTLYPPNKYYHAVFFDRNDDVLNVWDKGSGAHIRAIRYF